jgi:hypothetical protein
MRFELVEQSRHVPCPFEGELARGCARENSLEDELDDRGTVNRDHSPSRTELIQSPGVASQELTQARASTFGLTLHVW